MNSRTSRLGSCILILGSILAFVLSGCLGGGSSNKADYQTDSRVLGEFANLEAYLGTVDPAAFRSRSRNTPFGGRALRGRAVATFAGGVVVFRA